MLSLKNNFLFIHLPKTGGNSLQSILQRYSEDKLVCLNPLQDGIERFEVRSQNPKSSLHKHSRLIDYQKELPTEIFKHLFKFTTIRNPWERAISFYFSPHRQTTTWDRNKFFELLKTIKPMKEMLCLQGVEAAHFWSNVNFILRFENLNNDFQEVCKKIGLPTENLPIRNQSLLKNKDYKKFYDQELISLVAEHFQEEISFGRYEFK